VLIFDGHLDLAWNALQWGRDLTLPAHTIRTLEVDLPGRGRALGTVALPDLRRGGVGLCVATLLARSTGTVVQHLDWPSAQQAFAVAQGQLAYYTALERVGLVRIIRSASDLERCVEEQVRYAAAEQDEAPPLGLVLSMESADPVLAPDDLEEWTRAGVRAIGPAHYGPGRYAGGTGTELGLTDLGRALLVEMERLNVVLDVTHLSDRAFDEALELYGGPIWASHSNCRALVPHQRQFSDDQLRRIVERDGVVGAAFDAWMLQPGWIRGVSRNDAVSMGAVVDHIEHVCRLAGDARHAAIGSDLDGGFGREQSPHDLDTIADLQRLPALLAERGYTEDDLTSIMQGAWVNLLRRVWADDGAEPAT